MELVEDIILPVGGSASGGTRGGSKIGVRGVRSSSAKKEKEKHVSYIKVLVNKLFHKTQESVQKGIDGLKREAEIFGNWVWKQAEDFVFEWTVKHPLEAAGLGVPTAAAVIGLVKKAPSVTLLQALPALAGKTNAYVNPMKRMKRELLLKRYHPSTTHKIGDWKSLPFHTRLARTVGPGIDKFGNMLFGAVAGHMPLVWYSKWMEPQPHYDSPGSVGRQRYADLRHLRYSLWDQENLAN